jgi:hypothetical protein
MYELVIFEIDMDFPPHLQHSSQPSQRGNPRSRYYRSPSCPVVVSTSCTPIPCANPLLLVP